MSKKYDAVCIGFIVQDIIVTDIPEDALTKDTSVAKEALITSGGDAGNEAITLAHLGSRTAPLVKIGRDAVGNSIYSILENEPVDRSLIIRDSAAEMMMAIVVIKPDGERSFLVKKGNSHYQLLPEEIPEEALKDTRAVTVGSLFCLPGLDGAPIAGILERARSYGAITICDMSHDLEHIGPEAQLPVYPHVDYMMPSLEEAHYVTGETDPDKIADYFLSRGVGNVVLKLGADGCFFKNAQKRFFSDPYEIKAVDTTGCGDNFLGGFTHALLKGWPIETCTDFACAVGAINATGLGAHHTIKSEQQVLSFMESANRRSIIR